MNHTLLSHHPYQLEYPLSSDNEFLSGDRPFSTSSHFSSSEFFQPSRRSGLISHVSSLNVPVNTAFRPNSLQDAPLHSNSSTLLLSPPDSLSGSLPASTTAPNSSTHYSNSTVPRYFSSNASSAEPYSNAPAPCHPQLLFESNSMSDYSNRPRPPAPYNSYPSGSASAMTYTASGLGSFQTQSQLPHPFQTHSIPRMSQNISIPDVHDTRYTTLQPFLQPPGPSWTPRETWSHPTNMANDLRSGRQNSPPFEETKVLRDVFNYQGQRISPEIHASIPKGFFEVEGKWTCYRRNYFPVLCSFTTKPAVPDGAYLLQREGQQPARILEFAVSISAKTAVLNNQESQSRGLVQHTPKRDKATESTPGRVIIQPSTQTSPETRHPALHPYSSPQTVSPNMISHYESFSGGQHPTTPTQHTFERIQFQKATANNGKRRAQQQFFHVVVELWANVGHAKEEWVQLATRQSAQMVVRGRSPGHYKDNVRRDSTASMDPDRGTGSGGDSIFHGSGPTIGSHSHSNGGMEWSRTNGGGGHHYGGGTYRRQATDCSPESDNSSGTFTESHTEVEAGLETTPGIESPIDGACKPLEAQYGDGPDFDLGGSTDTTSLKRRYEGEHAFMPSMLESRRAYHVDAYLPSHLDFSLSQPLSVS